jgi:type IV pilus assembly protein PilA
MAVVAVVAILATLGVYGVRNYILSAKTSEAIEMIGAIKAAQESYRAETFVYLDVSGVNDLVGTSTFYPKTTPDRTKTGWGAGTSAVANNWRTLGVVPEGPVQFIYGCAAGSGTQVPAAPGMTVTNWPTAATGEPWYVVRALSDLDGDGVLSNYVSSSFANQIFYDKEGE